jgi:Ca2+/H+ antiporter, TMEM165/GDT1 family
MFASLVVSTRGKPRSVWLGAVAAFVVHVTIAVTIGVAIFHLLPRRVVESIVALMFPVGAALALREAVKVKEEESPRRARGGLEPTSRHDRVHRDLLG